MVADAQRAGRQALEQLRSQAQEQARERMRQAERRAGERSAQSASQSRKNCDNLRKAAQERLDAAANEIVKRVMEGNYGHC